MKGPRLLVGFAVAIGIVAPLSVLAETVEEDLPTPDAERPLISIDEARPIGEVLPPVPPETEPVFELSDSELESFVKRFATRIALTLTTYDPDDELTDVAARLPARSNPEAVIPAIRALHHSESWSRGRIIYPQFGGLLPDQASVMVVVEQKIGAAAGIRTETRTLDIRVRLQNGDWYFEDLASHGGDPVPRPETLSPEALAVVDNPRIELPDTALWDIYAGRVAPELLNLMARAARHVPYGVIVFDSGHPWNIFGTDRMSDHARGIAVDVHRVGDSLVIDDRAEGSLTHQFVEWLYEQPDVARIGSPWALDGFGGRSFTDLLHQDHLHIAVPRDYALRDD